MRKQIDEMELSKTMSWILRHGIHKLKLKMDDMGRISLDDLMNVEQIKRLGVTDDKFIREIVKTSNKKRFRLDNVQGKWMIGANQGHSAEIGDDINTCKLMKKIVKPLELCVHGTYTKFIDSIKQNGLHKMSRTHIHMATDYPNNLNVVSGARKSANVFIVIDMEKAMTDGIEFFQSANGVILTQGINGVLHPNYFKFIHEC